MKEAKKGYCEKCGIYFYVHDHHILPQSRFGKGATSKLCPNCHTHFHEYAKQRITKPDDADEAMQIWTFWLRRVSVTMVVLLVLFVLFRFV